MEIKITDFFKNAAPSDFSASCAEIGQNAARDTWQAALEEAEDTLMLHTSEQLEAFRDHIRGFGAWSDEEIDGYSVTELNALFIQCVSGDIREAGLDTDCPDWTEYERGASAGQYSGRLYLGDDSEIYYSIGD
jgi:hypothetical protein